MTTLSGSHAITSFHARLLVLLAEHQPVATWDLIDDRLGVVCACGNTLYTGHLIRLITGIHEDPPAPPDEALIHARWHRALDDPESEPPGPIRDHIMAFKALGGDS